MTTEGKQLTVIQQICNTIDVMEPSLTQALNGTGINTKRFIATAKTAIQSSKDRAGLEAADRSTLFLAVQRAAGDGLMPDGREAALVVYNEKYKDANGKDQWKKTVNYQPMVQGLMKLARNSDQIEDVDAFIVYEKDHFSFKQGKDKMPDHDGNWFGDRGKPIGIWAFVKLKSGEMKVAMFPKERIDRIAIRSKVPKNYKPSFIDAQGEMQGGLDWEEWWKKAAIRNILKYAPKSTALEKALDNDQEIDLDEVSAEPVSSAPVNPVTEAPRSETRAAQAVKAKQEKAEDKVIDLEPVKEEEPTPPKEEEAEDEIPI